MINKKISIFDSLYSGAVLLYLIVQFSYTLNAFLVNISLFILTFFSVLDFAKNFQLKKSLNIQILWYLIFVLFCLFSSQWALNSIYSKQVNVILLRALLGVAGLCLYNRNINRWKNFVKIFVYSCVYLSIYVLLITPVDYYGTNYFGRETGVYFNNISQTLAFGVLMNILITKLSRNKLNILLNIPMVATIVFSGSRKAILMLICGSVIFFLFSQNNILQKVRSFIIIFIGVWISIQIIMNNELLYTLIGERLLRIFEIFNAKSSNDASVIERAYYIKTGTTIFAKHPWLGVGINNFKVYLMNIGYVNPQYAHNNYIELLSDVGMIGFSTYYFYYAYIGKSIFLLSSTFERKTEEKLIFLMLLITFISLVILEYGNVTYYFIQYQVVLVILGSYLFIGNNSLNRNGEVLY